MNITKIAITLGEDCKISQSHHKLTIKSDTPQITAADHIKIEFDGTFTVELRKNAAGKTVMALSAGGIQRVMDTNTLQHLAAMNY